MKNFNPTTTCILVLIMVALTSGCKSNPQNDAATLNSQAVITTDSNKPVTVEMQETLKSFKREEEQTSPPTLITEQKIIRKANLRFQVADFKKSTEAINQLIPRYQAQLITANENRSESTLESDLTIKVLPQQFDPLLTKLSEQSIYLDSKDITSQDVTAEYIDISARLKTKKAVERRYLDLLRQAKSVKDIIAVEEQLSQIREEIESAEARITYLSRQTSYNTIELTYYQTLAATFSPETSFAMRVRNALQGGWEVLLTLLIGLLQLWPLLFTFPIFVIILRRFIRRYLPVR